MAFNENSMVLSLVCELENTAIPIGDEQVIDEYLNSVPKFIL